MNIESSFYDALTKEKIDAYKAMMISSATAAKECGGVCNSPFSNVNLTEYSTAKRDATEAEPRLAVEKKRVIDSFFNRLRRCRDRSTRSGAYRRPGRTF